MDYKTYTLYPPIKMTTSLNSFSVNIYELKLFEYVKLACVLYNTDGSPMDTRLFVLEGEEYNKWSSDDQYIISYIKAKLNGESYN